MDELIKQLRGCKDIECCADCPRMPNGLVEPCDIKEDAADAIEKLIAQLPKWISVEERLPENDDEVIVAYKCTYEPGIRVSTDCYNPRAGRWDLDHQYTHWMPLPKAPDLT